MNNNNTDKCYFFLIALLMTFMKFIVKGKRAILIIITIKILTNYQYLQY